MYSNESDHPGELDDVVTRLRDDRTELTPLELDELKLRIRSRSRTAHSKRGLMKSRMAVTMMVVLGLLLSTAGAGIAVEGISDSGSASVAQYGKKVQEPSDRLGDVDDPSDPAAEAQAGRQQATEIDDDELPFTGFAAIPLLIGGVALVGGGLVLRRRTEEPSEL